MTFKQIIHRFNRRDLRILPKLSSPLKISLVVLFAFITIFTTKIVFAETSSAEANSETKRLQGAILEGNNQEAWLDNAIGANMMSLKMITSGTIPEEILNGNINPQNTYIPGGMIGITNEIIASTYTPMASGVEYIAQMKNDFFGKPAYAAETGFDGLKSIMNLWKIFRNIVYVLISLIFVAMGIMIMLRIKISPQAVVTIQSSIPKIITTLVLVTFSYAIAGFCIDIINVFQALSISLLFNGMGKELTQNLFPEITWGNISLQNLISAALSAIFGVHVFDFKSLSIADFWDVWTLVERLSPTSMLTLLGGLVGAMFGPVGAGIGALAINLVFSIIILILLIKLVFGLAKCYLTAILKIIFAPFELLLGIFPNSKSGFSSWIIGIIANLAVFPVCLIFLIIANILIDNLGNIINPLWAPTLIQGPIIWFLPLIVGITAIALLAKLPQMVPEAIFQIKPSPFGKAIGEGFKSLPGVGLVGAGINTVKSGATEIGSDAISGKWKTQREKRIIARANAANVDNVPENESNGPKKPPTMANSSDTSSKRNKITSPPNWGSDGGV